MSQILRPAKFCSRKRASSRAAEGCARRRDKSPDGLQFFETSGPDGVGDALSDGVAGDSEAAALEKTGGGEGVENVLQLETAGETGGEIEYVPERFRSRERA